MTLSDKSIHDAVVDVFKEYGFGPFDMEAVIHFAIQRFEPTAFNYISIYNQIRAYIATHFECRKGSLMCAGELSLTRTLVYYRE